MNIYDDLYRSLDHDVVVTVDIAELVQALDYSEDATQLKYRGCLDWLPFVMLNKLHHRQMTTLIESLLADGLTCPLNVSYGGEGWGFGMGNGHHRLIAALLCGIKYIDVYVTCGIDFTLSSPGRLDLDLPDHLVPELSEVSADVGAVFDYHACKFY